MKVATKDNKTWLNTTTLAGEIVELRPLKREHAQALVDAASDGELWQLWFTQVPSKDNIKVYINKALEQQDEGMALPFVVVEKATQTIVGCTRLCNAVNEHKRIEIGYTWYAKRVQRTAINSQCKLLLLQFAFEQLNCIAVEFRTHWHNIKSRNAIARLGAKQDGVLRNHQIAQDGTIRDTVVFSIINTEWPVVKKSLLYKVASYNVTN